LSQARLLAARVSLEVGSPANPEAARHLWSIWRIELLNVQEQEGVVRFHV